MSVKDKLKLLKSGKLAVKENVENFLSKIKKENPKINAFIDLNLESCLDDAEYLDRNRDLLKDKKLFGLCVAIKSSISVKNHIISSGSETLKNYVGGYDATVVKKIKEEGAVILGMTNCDEFCAGSSGETSAFGPTLNPQAPDRIPGGSSSGSAAAVAAGMCDLALGSDTGGSIRNPASHCGVVGVKPTYGTVSRYGLLDLSMSLEQIGPLASSVDDAQLLLDVIKGKDEHDTTTYDIKESPLSLEKKEPLGRKKLRVGIPKIKADEKIWDLIKKRVEEVCKREGWGNAEVNMDYIDLGVQAYYPINYVEFYSATRKYDGRRFGEKIEEVCGDEVLRRILGGEQIAQEEFAGKYYRKALQAKKLIEEEFEKTLKKYDCLIMPTSPKLPHKFGEKLTTEEMYQYDTLTSPINLAGVPAISIPAGKIRGVPVGLQIICAKFNDSKMLEIAKKFELN